MYKVLYVYKWATMGGVERVLLNRAQAFKASNANVSQDVYFLHNSGGKELLKKYIYEFELGTYLRVVDEFLPYLYDSIHPIDTPEIFEMTKNKEKIFFECHTAYKENRKYIRNLPQNIKGVIVPSEKFKSDIIEELPVYLQNRTNTLRNCVPEEISRINNNNYVYKRYNKIPLCYIGRIDKLKNTEEVIEIFALLQKQLGDHFLLVIAGPITPEVDLFSILKSKGLLDRFIYLPPLPFEKTQKLLAIIHANDGIFISSSKGESFGLSVAEAISFGLPIIVSNIHSHLVKNNSTFLYHLGDIEDAVQKIKFILENKDIVMKELSLLKESFSNSNFLDDWNTLFL